MKTRVLRFLMLCTLIVITFFALSNFFSEKKEKNYVEIYRDFYSNEMETFLNANQEQITLDLEDNRKYYILDLENDDEPEFIIISDTPTPQSVVISYNDGEFQLKKPLDLKTNIGTGGSEFKMIMHKNDTIYYYAYKSKRLEYGEDSKFAFEEKVYTTYRNGNEKVVEQYSSEDGIVLFHNGKELETDAMRKSIIDGYEVLIDTRDLAIK